MACEYASHLRSWNIFFDVVSFLCQQVVNALLTQLDKLKHKKNALVMSTSNLAKAIGYYYYLYLEC
jgi:hypothetical protein